MKTLIKLLANSSLLVVLIGILILPVCSVFLSSYKNPVNDVLSSQNERPAPIVKKIYVIEQITKETTSSTSTVKPVVLTEKKNN
jgi:hypothetical protein